MATIDHAPPFVEDVRRLPPGPALLFFLGVPTLIGVLLGATGAGAAAHFPWGIGIAFWVASGVAVWVCLYAGSVAAAVALRPWRAPLWVVLTLGALIGSLVGRYAIYGVAELLAGWMEDGRTPKPMPGFAFSADFVIAYLQGWAGVFAAWVLVGLAFDRWLATPGYGRGMVAPATDPMPAAAPQAAAPGAVALSPAASAFLDRLPKRLGRNVLTLEAADHYVRVTTDRGSDLVFGRLADAIEALKELDGVRVHRSWWVRRSAVVAMHPQGKGFVLDLAGGGRVPVAQAYREVARQAGFPSGT